MVMGGRILNDAERNLPQRITVGLPSRPRRLRAWSFGAALALLSSNGCQTTKEVEKETPTASALLSSWKGGEKLRDDPKLQEVASLLCSRDTDAVIDADARTATFLKDAQVAGVMGRGATAKAAAQDVLAAAEGVLDPVFATHKGAVLGTTPSGSTCLAVVVARRHADAVGGTLGPPADGAQLVEVVLHEGRTDPVLYVARPDGSVRRIVLEPYPSAGLMKAEQAVRFDRGDGLYTFELVVNVGPEEPEIAMLWRVLHGQKPRSPPAVDVLFPDEGHSDRALTRRAEALVSRLRTTQLLDTMKISPTLSKLSYQRVQALSGVGILGHKVPSGQSAFAGLRQLSPSFGVARLGEVQAQAGTLDEAWRALIQSPAHRYELVEPKNTHMGVAVQRAPDAAGRSLLSLVVIVARKSSERSRAELSTELVGRFNLARNRAGSTPLRESKALAALAVAHAEAMATKGNLDEMTAGDDGEPTPVAAVAQMRVKGLADVRAVLAKVSDPLRLAPSAATLAPEMRSIGVGLFPQGVDGQWYVCVLVGEPDAR